VNLKADGELHGAFSRLLWPLRLHLIASHSPVAKWLMRLDHPLPPQAGLLGFGAALGDCIGMVNEGPRGQKSTPPRPLLCIPGQKLKFSMNRNPRPTRLVMCWPPL
jgi:hypothetical protein